MRNLPVQAAPAALLASTWLLAPVLVVLALLTALLFFLLCGPPKLSYQPD